MQSVFWWSGRWNLLAYSGSLTAQEDFVWQEKYLPVNMHNLFSFSLDMHAMRMCDWHYYLDVCLIYYQSRLLINKYSNSSISAIYITILMNIAPCEVVYLYHKTIFGCVTRMLQWDYIREKENALRTYRVLKSRPFTWNPAKLTVTNKDNNGNQVLLCRRIPWRNKTTKGSSNYKM